MYFTIHPIFLRHAVALNTSYNANYNLATTELPFVLVSKQVFLQNHVVMKKVSSFCKFIFMSSNSFSREKLYTRTHFETEVKGHLEMANLLITSKRFIP